MYNSINEFLQDWRFESSQTLKVLDALTDASLKQAVSDAQPRTLGDLAWHLVGSFGPILGAAGLQFDVLSHTEQPSASAAAAADNYRRASDAFVTALTEQWTDAKLRERLMMFGFMDTNYAGVLEMFVRHQIHHRGQITILMRQAGLVPPGVYGPNEEESAAMRAARAQQ